MMHGQTALQNQRLCFLYLCCQVRKICGSGVSFGFDKARNGLHFDNAAPPPNEITRKHNQITLVTLKLEMFLQNKNGLLLLLFSCFFHRDIYSFVGSKQNI